MTACLKFVGLPDALTVFTKFVGLPDVFTVFTKFAGLPDVVTVFTKFVGLPDVFTVFAKFVGLPDVSPCSQYSNKRTTQLHALKLFKDSTCDCNRKKGHVTHAPA